MMGNRSRKNICKKRIGSEKFVAPMERVRLELERVFEPGDIGRERGVSIDSSQLRGYFQGREDNPLRSCYESFVI
jgi:hypothetical protein